MRRFLSIALRLLISATLLVVLFHEHSLSGQVLPHLQSLLREWPWTLLGIASAGASVLISAWRWWVVLRAQVPGVSFALALKATVVSGFFTITSLGPIGADAYRVLAIRSHYPRQGMAIGASVVIDHLAGLVSMAVVFLGFGLAALKQWPAQAGEVKSLLHAFTVFLLVASVGIGLSVVSLSPGMMNWGRKRMPWLLNHPFMIKMEASFSPLWSTWRSSLLASGISVGIFFFTFFTFYCGVRAVGGSAPLLPVLLAMPVVDMAAALPISVSGLGVREKTFETLMAALCGLPEATGVAASLAGWLFNVCWGLFGGLLFILTKPAKTPSPQVSPGTPTISDLQALLEQPYGAPEVARFLDAVPLDYSKDAGAAYAALKQRGISVVLDETGGQYEETVTPSFWVSCIHLYPQGKDGYEEYDGALPGGVAFRDKMKSVLKKMGEPKKRGGGGYSDLLQKNTPAWLKYDLGNCEIHFEFDGLNRLSFASLLPQGWSPSSHLPNAFPSSQASSSQPPAANLGDHSFRPGNDLK